MAKKTTKSAPKKKKTTAPKAMEQSAAPKTGTEAKPAKTKTAEQSAEPKTAPRAAAPKPTGKALLLQRFDRWVPPAPYLSSAPDSSDYTAPPFYAKAPKGLKALLARKFDIPTTAAVPPAPSKAAPKKVFSVRELLARSFPAWKPGAIFTPTPPAITFTAPPLFDAPPAGLGELLKRRFDAIDFAALAREAEVKAAQAKAEAEKRAAEERAVKEKAEAENKAAEEAARKPVSIPELLKKAFDRWRPETLYAPPPSTAVFTAPASDGMPADFREILSRKFDLDFVALAREAEERKAAAKKAEEECAAAGVRMRALREAAEKAAAEKAEADRAAQEQTEKERLAKDCCRKMRPYAYGAAAAGLVFGMITATSISNSSRYYIEPRGERIQVFQGHFSPMGRKLVASLSGAQSSESFKPVYGRGEAYNIVFDHYLRMADTSLANANSATLENVKMTLERALEFATSALQREAVETRMAEVKMVVLLHRADVAVAQNNQPVAQAYLEEAARLYLKPERAAMVKSRLEAVRAMAGETAGTVTSPK